MGHWWAAVGIGVLMSVLILGLLLFLALPGTCPSERSPRLKSADNIRTLLTLKLAAGQEGAGLHGRNWILALVAHRDLDPRNVQNLELLWSPYRWDLYDVEDGAYEALTLELLKRQRFPHLTGYSGPGEQQPGWKGPIPLIGDLTVGDGAIIGFSDGSVRWLDREELGLGDDDPIVVGPTSKSPLLRMLSSE